LAGSVISGVEDAVDVIGSLTEDVVVLVSLALFPSGAGGTAGATGSAIGTSAAADAHRLA